VSGFARCPGNKYGGVEGCDSLVKIIEWQGELRINFCCQPCFRTTWEPTQFFLGGDEDYEPVDYGHSAQCHGRQFERFGSPVTEGDFVLTGRVPDAPTP
jgi:hypothetical protein